MYIITTYWAAFAAKNMHHINMLLQVMSLLQWTIKNYKIGSLEQWPESSEELD